jgi:hypothetical protein
MVIAKLRTVAESYEPPGREEAEDVLSNSLHCLWTKRQHTTSWHFIKNICDEKDAVGLVLTAEYVDVYF